MLILTTSFQHYTGSSCHCNKLRKRKKGIEIRREEVKQSLFVGDVIIYIEEPEESTQQLLEQMSLTRFQSRSIYKTIVYQDA